MENKEIARLISELSDLKELKGANVFQIRAYQRAAQIIENIDESLAAIHERGELESIDGIGKGIAEKIGELLNTGTMQELDEIKSSFPEGLLQLLDVPGLGPKKVKLFYEKLEISSVEELKNAAESGKLQKLPGMGKKSEEKILKGLQTSEQSTGRFTLGEAYPAAVEILDRIRKIKGVQQAEFAGSMRRGRETVGDVDILVAAENSEPVMKAFLETDTIRDVLANGKTKSSAVLNNHLQVDLRVVPQKSFGAALQYFTGSKDHNVKLREWAVKHNLKVNEYGVFPSGSDNPIAGETEEEVYKALEMTWIPPELREGSDELDLAREDKLPKLITQKDFRSILHNHTTSSDGKMSLQQLVQEAQKRGYEFLAVTDHSGSLGIANGLNADRLKKQIEEIHKFNERTKNFTVLTGSEVDIKADGSLDFEDDLLEQLDFVVASVHMSQDQPRDKMTGRICHAISNPHVDLLGHPSGRLLGRRPPMEIDFEKVFETAREWGTVMEINAHYMRLDLHDRHIREAKRYGLRFSVNTDTHHANNFENMVFGLQTARRGRLTAKDVINTMTLKELKKFLDKKNDR